jgi:TPR repeat protein
MNMSKYEVQVSVERLKPELKKNFKLKFNILAGFLSFQVTHHHQKSKSATSLLLSTTMSCHSRIRKFDDGPNDGPSARRAPPPRSKKATFMNAMSPVARDHCLPYLEDDAAALCSLVRTCGGVRDLVASDLTRLVCPRLSDGLLEASCPCFLSTNLLELDVSQDAATGADRLTDVGLVILAQRCTNLRRLKARNCRGVRDAGVALAASCAHLEELDLSVDPGVHVGADQGVTDASVTALAAQRHGTLKVLQLCNAPALTDASLAAIGDARCAKLTTLRLERCPEVGRQDAGLAGVAEHCTALASVELGGCPLVSPKAVRDLAARMGKRMVRLGLNGCIRITFGMRVELVKRHLTLRGHLYVRNVVASRYCRGRGGEERNYPKAALHYQQLADQGHKVAQYMLGVMYRHGRGVDQDDARAVHWYRKAAKQGVASAHYNLGYMYMHGMGVDQDMQQAAYHYKQAADQGDAGAQYNMGFLYENAQGVDQDMQQAANWYQQAADQGNALAQCNLGVMYAYGRGVDQDDARAVHWYQYAADQGNAHAQCNLGGMYRLGRGVEQDDVQAVHWYRRAADQDHTSAQNNLAYMYARGRGVDQDDMQAVQWYREAAAHGHADAQCSLGAKYALGRGVTQDMKRAANWYRKAANQGNATAANNLGFMHVRGEGVDQDDVQAVHWYRQAADQGNAGGQFNLGVHYALGRGVAQDMKQAVHWYRQAADQGCAQAQRRLAQIHNGPT